MSLEDKMPIRVLVRSYGFETPIEMSREYVGYGYHLAGPVAAAIIMADKQNKLEFEKRREDRTV